MTFNRIFAVHFLALIGVFSLHAQPAAVQQLQNSQQAQQQQQILPTALTVGTNAPELYQGENLDVGPQRILRLKPHQTYFDAVADSEVFYTDNANFAQNPNMIGSAVFVNTIQAAFAPPPVKFGPGKFAPTAGFASQWYNYGNSKISSLDFQAQTLFVGGKYTLGNWQIGGGANYTRLVNQSSYDQTYSEFMPNFSVQRVFPIGDKMLLAVGDQIDYHFTQVPTMAGSVLADINDRFDDTVNLTFSWELTRRLILQPYYRFQYSNYKNNTLQTSDRNDYLHTFGVTVAYYFNKNLSLRTFFNYSRKQSDDPNTPAYHEYDGGLGASLDFKF
jgi:hypothetical protein